MSTMADEMDYVMHHPQDSSLSPPQQPQQHQSEQHQQQHQHHNHLHQAQHQPQQPIRQCPYWSDHSLSGFAGPYGGGSLPAYSPPRNPYYPQHNHPRSSASSSSHPQNAGLATPNSRSQAGHPYDPVHSSIAALNSSWYPGTPPYHWQPVTLPHPRPSFDSFWPYPANQSSPGGVGSPESNNNGSSSSGRGGAGAGGLDPASSSGPVQPPVAQNQQTPRHEPVAPFPPIAFHHQASSLHRFTALPPTMSAPNQNQNQNQQTGQQQLPPPGAMDGLSGARLPSLFVLPRLDPAPEPQLPQQQPQQNFAASGTASSSTSMADANSEPDRALAVPASGGRTLPPRYVSRDLPAPTSNSDNPRSENRRALLSNMRPVQRSGRRSDSDSDDDDDLLEEREMGQPRYDSMGRHGYYNVRSSSGDPRADQMRAHGYGDAFHRSRQLLRGQLTTKRVASRSAIASLNSVDIETLPEDERMCMICYTDFGVESPEGINEAPLRLPKCKHVFGDHCIKRWFEDQDSCPYCRDKVPSEVRTTTISGRPSRELFEGHMRSMGDMIPPMDYVPYEPPLDQERALHRAQHQRDLAWAREQAAELARNRDLAPAGGDGSPSRSRQTREHRTPPSPGSLESRRSRRLPDVQNFQAFHPAGRPIPAPTVPGPGDLYAYPHPGSAYALGPYAGYPPYQPRSPPQFGATPQQYGAADFHISRALHGSAARPDTGSAASSQGPSYGDTGYVPTMAPRALGLPDLSEPPRSGLSRGTPGGHYDHGHQGDHGGFGTPGGGNADTQQGGGGYGGN